MVELNGRFEIDPESQTWQVLVAIIEERRKDLITTLLSKDSGTPDDNRVRGKIAMLDELLTLGEDNERRV